MSEKRVTVREVYSSLKQNKPWLIFALNILFMWTGYFYSNWSPSLLFSSRYWKYNLICNSGDNYVCRFNDCKISLFLFSLARWAKEISILFLQSFNFLGCALIFLAGNHSLEILIGAVVSGLGYGIKESIYFSMQADPVDYGIWKTGINVSGSLSAINGFLGKVAQAIAGGVAGALLAWGSYNPNKSHPIRASGSCYQSHVSLCADAIDSLLHCDHAFYRLDTMYPMIEKELAEGKTQSDQG